MHNLISYNANNLLIEKMVHEFEEFLEHFNNDYNQSKNKSLATEMVKNGENILSVSIAAIKSHNRSLMKSIDSIKYNDAFPHLNKTLRNFNKVKIDKN